MSELPPSEPLAGGSDVSPSTIKNRHTGGKPGQRTPTRQLKDYRWVYRYPQADPEGRAATPIQSALRDLLKKDAAKFMDRLQKLEEAFASRSVSSASKEAPEVADEGTEAALAHAERFLEGLANGSLE